MSALRDDAASAGNRWVGVSSRMSFTLNDLSTYPVYYNTVTSVCKEKNERVEGLRTQSLAGRGFGAVARDPPIKRLAFPAKGEGPEGSMRGLAPRAGIEWSGRPNGR